MSLQLAAQHMASRGRGPDTTLVHMAPQEVAGLQALAKAHGGTLTVNPDTGLPEAGFLKSILPMVIGGALAATGVGAPLAAAMVGGGYGLATGSLSKGLMAGLGAYGGAGLAGGLMGAGAGAGAAQQAAMAGVPETASMGLDAGMGVYPEPSVFGATSPTLGSTVANPTGIPGFTGSTVGLTPPPSAIQAQQAVMQTAPQTVTQAPALTQQGLMNEAAARVTPGSDMFKAAGSSGFDTAKAGFGELVKNPSQFMTADNLKYGLAGLSPMLFQEPEQQARETEYPEYYSFDAGRLNERSDSGNYFSPTLTRIPRKAAGGGLMDIGPIQSMSDRNQAETMMANGGMRFAEGGETKAVKSVEQDPYYTMSGQSGDVFKYLMGQGANPMTAARNAQIPMAAPVAALPTDAAASTVSGGDSLNAGIQNYNFDPVTGRLAALPVIAPVAASSGGSGFYYEGSGIGSDGGGYGGGGGDTSGGYGDSAGYGAANGGLMQQRMAMGGISALARGGQSHLGDYSDGGRLLRGPGNGTSDDIPASIGDKRPARLADGEFVIPSRIVSELGNGSTEAGARQLYAMMDRVQKARAKTTGKNKVAFDAKARNLLPA